MKTTIDKLVGQEVQNASHPQWLKNIQSQSFAEFSKNGFPNRKHEAWKYTSLRPIKDAEIEAAKEGQQAKIEWQDSLASFKQGNRLRLVLLDGVFLPEESSDLSKLSSQLVFEKIVDSKDAVAAGYLERAPKEAFSLLNLASFSEGLFLKVKAKAEVDQAIDIIHLRSSASYRPMIASRLIIELEQSSSLILREYFVDPNQLESVSNHATQISVKQGAKLKHVRYYDESQGSTQMSNLDVDVARDATYDSANIFVGSSWLRSNQTVRLLETGAHATLDAVYCPAAGQHMDFCTVTDHIAPHTTSSQLYKGVLQKGSRAVFNGKVLIRKGSDQVRAEQLNKNLALDEGCEIDTRPQMEIDADDVRCAHGATVGQLDPDEIFYLQSRGIGPRQAVQMLAQAFVGEVLQKHRDWIDYELIQKRLLEKVNQGL